MPDGTRGAGGSADRPGPVTLGQALRDDGVRTVIVTVSYLFCLVGALACFGVISRSGQRLQDVLTAYGSLLAPASEAARLWWVSLAGLGAYVAWLWLPGRRSEPRARAVGYASALAMALLGLWFLLARSGSLLVVAVGAVVVLAALVEALRRAGRVPAATFLGRLFTQLGLAVACGQMTVLATSAVAAELAAHHVPAPWLSAETWGILGVTALVAGGMALLRYLPGRLYVAGSLAWGFVWIAYARVLGHPRAYLLAVVALVSALLVLIAGVAVFGWARSRRWERRD